MLAVRFLSIRGALWLLSLGAFVLIMICLASANRSHLPELEPANTETTLRGAGGSFPAPLYQKWFRAYHAAHPEVKIEYQSIGSGNGVKAVIDKTVDFGSSDAGMTREEMEHVDGGVQLLPITAGSIVLAYHLEGIENLKLSREAYAGIFLGKVTKWNDPLIAANNAGVSLPSSDIHVIVRAEVSGTTFVFTKHLSAISEQFAAHPGASKLPDWPVGTWSQCKGNEGVAAALNATPGSIGYVEYGFAKGAKLKLFGYGKRSQLNIAWLQNKAGRFVEPTTASATAALSSLGLPQNLIDWVSDPEGDNSYPIVTYTWIICYKQYADANKVLMLKALLNYCLSDGQRYSEALGYVPLPQAVIEQSKAALNNIHEVAAQQVLKQ
jgi:phosphate transport system substrate-binding protein